MDYWLNIFILAMVAVATFYIGYRVGFVDGETNGECDCECWFENDDAEESE